MYLLDQLLSILAPHRCLGCSREGSLLCYGCAAGLPPATERCYRCQKPSPTSLTCTACLTATPLLQVRSVAPYAGPVKQLIARLKYDGAVAAARSAGQLMSGLIDVEPDVLIVPVPTSNARRRQRGYDQAELLARIIAARTGLTYSRLLARHGERHQIGASRAQRQEQLQGIFRVRRPFAAGSILLIDDVVTTGSTLEAAAKVLEAVGVAGIRALTFAQA